MTRMNILISSSRQWNPGDEFIRKGVERLLGDILGPNHNWLLWNRNPDLFMDRWTDGRMRTDFLTNSMRDPALDVVDLVVFAGTPEWFGQPVERIYRSLLTQPRVPVLVLGAGSGAAMPQLAPHEVEVLDRGNVFICTRSVDLAECLNAQLSTPKAVPLPCPAFYSVGEPGVLPDRHRVGVIVQSSGTPNQNVGEELVQTLISALRAAQGKIDLDIVSLYIDEHMRFSRLGLEHACVYSYEPDHLLAQISGYSTIISTRLHGAIAGLSAGVPSILLAEEGNFRLRSTEKPFGNLLPILTVQEAFRVAAESSPEETRRQSTEILSFKKSAYENLRGKLRDFLADAIPGRLS
ncbi:Polysaccharide pyruvyl transferase [Burkholderia sp. WP9]|uniref:polysaccharide pyruvyl transferase family protein n=1 Tax=Burkholderia sp. WP9 TaxID=1500263 RepID=UPI000894BE31|nr:polysaccharide pyruvyl transferase family protein [Burkholderia sp. WP9]SED05454.1 Polysaccharide pyruvyl transferase [Burkholderia sp. WP9]